MLEPSSHPVEIPDTSAPTRILALDGLRGVAAIIVLMHHLSLTLPGISDVFLRPSDAHPPVIGSLLWWFTSTPAQLLLAGPEAVLVFFIISGVALTSPVLVRERFNWVSYFPQRLLRLYLPVIGSVLLAALLVFVSHQNVATAQSGWLAQNDIASLGWRRVLTTMDVLFGDTSMNNPLWSLRWEVVFSLSLPVFIIVAIAVRRWWLLAVLGSVTIAVLGDLSGIGLLQYLPAFFIGTVLAGNRESFALWFDAWATAQRNVLGVSALLASLSLINFHWLVASALESSPTLATLSDSLVLVGAVGLVAVTLFWHPLERTLSRRPMLWLGQLSFSLYLVHVPIITAVSSLLGGLQPWLIIVVSAIAALGAAVIFRALIEAPAHRLSKFVSSRISADLARRHQENDYT